MKLKLKLTRSNWYGINKLFRDEILKNLRMDSVKEIFDNDYLIAEIENRLRLNGANYLADCLVSEIAES